MVTLERKDQEKSSRRGSQGLNGDTKSLGGHIPYALHTPTLEKGQSKASKVQGPGQGSMLPGPRMVLLSPKEMILYLFSAAFFFFFFFFRAAPAANGSSWAKDQRGRIGASAASLHHSHSNTGSVFVLAATLDL